jgi:predicted nucleic acid-binding protein
MFFKDNYTERVRKLIANSGSEECKTLDFAYAEVSNVAWKRIISFGENQEYVLKNLKLAIDFLNKMCEITKVREIIDETVELALMEKTSFYDTAFLQLAMINNDKLLTIDLKFYNKLEQKYKKFVIIP